MESRPFESLNAVPRLQQPVIFLGRQFLSLNILSRHQQPIVRIEHVIIPPFRKSMPSVIPEDVPSTGQHFQLKRRPLAQTIDQGTLQVQPTRL